MKRLALFMAVVAVALAAAVPAYGSSVTDTYSGHSGGVLGAVNNNSGGGGNAPTQVRAANTGSGSLPFTGLDIGLLALGGGALVGVGVGLRRLARPLS
jgi:hypothetical protein